MSKDDLVFHLSEHHGDGTPGSKVFIDYTGDLKAYHTLLLEKKYKYNRPGLEQAFWNALTMEITDPSGNKIVFSKANGEV